MIVLRPVVAVIFRVCPVIIRDKFTVSHIWHCYADVVFAVGRVVAHAEVIVRNIPHIAGTCVDNPLRRLHVPGLDGGHITPVHVRKFSFRLCRFCRPLLRVAFRRPQRVSQDNLVFPPHVLRLGQQRVPAFLRAQIPCP